MQHGEKMVAGQALLAAHGGHAASMASMPSGGGSGSSSCSRQKSKPKFKRKSCGGGGNSGAS